MELCCVLVLLLAGTTFATIEKRIYGGNPCEKGQRGYHVEVKSEQLKTACGGALLSSKWVITASHCAQRVVNVEIWKRDPVLFKQHSQKINADRQTTFEDDQGIHDITLIELKKEVKGFPGIVLPHVGCTRPNEGDMVGIGGWGATKEKSKSKSPYRLRCASTKIGACGPQDKPGAKYFSDETTTMCGTTASVKSCHGDAGSAVEFQGHIYGIIVSDPVDTCANPVVMLDICKYREWIKKITSL